MSGHHVTTPGRDFHERSARAVADPELQHALPEGTRYLATAYYQQLQADVLFEAARAYQTKRMASQAIENYSRSLGFDPNRAEAHRQLADLFARKGDRARAAEHAAAVENLRTAPPPR